MARPCFRGDWPLQVFCRGAGGGILLAWLLRLEGRAGVCLRALDHLLLGGQPGDGLRDGLERRADARSAAVGRLRRRRLLVLVRVLLVMLLGGARRRRRGGRRLREVDVGRRRREFALGVEQSGLEVDHVFPERVVFGLHRLVRQLQIGQVSNLLLELLDVALLALAESSL